MDELLTVFAGDHRQVADHPAAVGIFPIIGQANEIALASDIWKKRKLAAGHRAELALAQAMALALDQYLAWSGLGLHTFLFGRVGWLPGMPHGRVGLQILPFGLVG
jgi:hypothetical protein